MPGHSDLPFLLGGILGPRPTILTECLLRVVVVRGRLALAGLELLSGRGSGRRNLRMYTRYREAKGVCVRQEIGLPGLS
jgi:hypothetical protein